MDRKTWDNLYNEGEEGYNPCPQQPSIPQWIILLDKRDKIRDIMTGVSTGDPRYQQLEAELVVANELLAAAKKEVE